jgi:hypothetical protein
MIQSFNYCRPYRRAFFYASFLLLPIIQALGAVASERIVSEQQVQKMLKIASAPNLDYFKMLSARSLGLPDTASSAEIQAAYTHACYLAEAKMFGWPLNLSDTEYGVLSEQRRKLALAQYGYPEVASDGLSQALHSVKEAVMFAPRSLFNLAENSLPSSWSAPIGEALIEYENKCRLIAAKQSLGLLPWASDKQLEDVQHENLRTMLVKGLHLKPTASFEEINIVQSQNSKQEHSQLLHRIFKADGNVPDEALEKQLKPLAIALGYPIYRGTNCAGSGVATADDLLTAAVGPKLIKLPNGLSIAP